MHPDAESLTAFAEQLLPAPEREQILAHMATCGRCREVVFLAQKAAGEDEPGIVAVYTRERYRPGRRWFTRWQWTWVPVAALAGIVGVAVVLHFQHVAEPGPQLAAKLAPTDALGKAEVAPAAPVSSASTEAVREQAAPRRVPPDQVQKDVRKQLNEEKPAEERDAAALGSGGALHGVIGGLAGGSTHEATAKAKSLSLGGPMDANQIQQNSNQLQQQNLPQQQALEASRNAPALDADKPVTANAAPRSVTQSVIQEPQAIAPQAAPAPVPPMTLSSVASETVPLKGRQVTDLKKVAKIELPSGAGVLSSASTAGRTIALDTAGALFVRDDNQKHWKAVQAQWTGRAVLVRTRPVSETAQSAFSLGFVQNPRFELVTDKLQTWVSADGKRWTAEKPPGK
jgi:hypothetical protein